MRMQPAVSLVTAVVLCAAGTGWAQNLGGAQASGPLRVEWETRQIGGGRAVVSGYVYNRHLLRAEHIRLRVETLDASSRASSTRTVYVTGTVPPGDRGYFEVRVPTGEATYRVTVESFDWFSCGEG